MHFKANVCQTPKRNEQFVCQLFCQVQAVLHEEKHEGKSVWQPDGVQVLPARDPLRSVTQQRRLMLTAHVESQNTEKTSMRELTLYMAF